MTARSQHGSPGRSQPDTGRLPGTGHLPGSGRRRGFTLVELLVVVAIASMLIAVVVPNLGSLVPAARLQGSGAQIQRKLDWLRSEARIQGKRMAIEFDLDQRRWRMVFPPEQRLTRDQDVSTLEEQPEMVWQELEDDVVFASIDTGTALSTRGLYRLVFDEYGFTGDQVVNLKLQSDPQQTWSLQILGLSGRVTIFESSNGDLPRLPQIGEGAF